MWRCNDFLPGLKGVGWKTALTLHKNYKKLRGDDEKVDARAHAYINTYFL